MDADQTLRERFGAVVPGEVPAALIRALPSRAGNLWTTAALDKLSS